MLVQLLLNAIPVLCLLALGGVGFAIVYRTTRVFHIAYAATFSIGAYSVWYAGQLGVGPVIGTLAGIMIASLLGLFTDFALTGFRSRIGLPPAQLFVGSLGVYIAAAGFISILFGTETKLPIQTFSSVFSVRGLIFSHTQVVQVVVSLSVVATVLLLYTSTFIGRLIVALSDDPELVALLGRSTAMPRGVAVAGGFGLGACSGALRYLETGVTPYDGLSFFTLVVTAVIIGSLSSLWGVVLGSCVVAGLLAIASWLLEARWASVVVFAVLFGLLAVRHRGISKRMARGDVD